MTELTAPDQDTTRWHLAVPAKTSTVRHAGYHRDRCAQCAAAVAAIARQGMVACDGRPVVFGSVVRLADPRMAGGAELVTVTAMRVNAYTGEVWAHAFAAGENLVLQGHNIAEVYEQ